MAFSIVFLLLLFGFGTLLVLLVVAAIATRRTGLLAAGIALAVLAGCSLLGMLFVGSQRHNSNVYLPTTEIVVSSGSRIISSPLSPQYLDNDVVVAQDPPPIRASSATQPISGVNEGSPAITQIAQRITTSGAYLFNFRLLILFIAFVVAVLIRNGSSRRTAYLFRRGWALIPIVLVFGFLFVARSSTRTYTVAPPRTIENPNIKKVQISESERAGRAILAQQKHLEETRRAQQKHLQDTLTAQQKHIEATMAAQQKLVDGMNIDAEIDQFDAPRIPLSSDKPSPKSPPVPDANVAPVVVAPAVAAPTANGKANGKSTKPKASKTVVAKDTPVATKISVTGTDKPQPGKKTSKLAALAEADPDTSLPRPDWVDETPKRTGDTRREVVATDLYESIDECYQAADVFLLLKTYQRMQQLTGRPFSDSPLPTVTFKQVTSSDVKHVVAFFNGDPYWTDWRIRSLANMGIGADFARGLLVAKEPNGELREYIDNVTRSFGPMKKLYQQIEFTSAIDRQLQQFWDSYQRRERFAQFGVGAGSLLGFLGLVFAMLKVDTATKGYYTKRLFIGVPAAIIGVVTLLAVLDQFTSLL